MSRDQKTKKNELMKEAVSFARRQRAKFVVVVDADNRMATVANFNEPLDADAVRAVADFRDRLLPVLARYSVAVDDDELN